MSKGKKPEYRLSFVKEGKPFTLEGWTVKKQEEVFKETAKYEKELDKEQLDRKYRKILVLKGLHDVDATVSEEDLDTLHPDDFLAIFTAVYLQGKRGIFAEEKDSFRKGRTRSAKSVSSTE